MSQLRFSGSPRFALALFLSIGSAGLVSAQDSLTPLAEQVNKKMVKLFGAGGFKGLPSYGTGFLVSSRGHIVTVNNHILTTTDLRVHLYDGRFYHAKVLFREPELDIALCKIEGEADLLPHFDIEEEVKRPMGEAADWVLAASNCFQIATRDEPMSFQKGVIAARAELRGRRGVFDAPYIGEVYFLDIVANNPGAAGGVITNRKGDLLGILGRELKNTLTDTWINYAVPIHAKVEILQDEKKVMVDMAKFIREAMAGTYREGKRAKTTEDRGGYHGIVLVHNAVSATPAFIEEVHAGSPASKAGLLPDDLIVYVDGELVSTIKAFREIVRQVGPGMELRLEVQRGNRLHTIRLKLSEQPKVASK